MYDAIVVGARVAGAPTAMLLARKGYKILLVDRDTFPSDIMSTHYIHLPGVAKLKRWDLLDAVLATNCPPLHRLTVSWGETGELALSGQAPPFDGVNAALCPRRTVLDQVLVDAAVAAGAELREGFVVEDVLTNSDTVTGVRGHQKGGPSVTEQARIVVGADGIHSVIARRVQPAEYNVRPALGCGYYAYYSGVPMDGAEVHFRDDCIIFGFPTNDGRTCLAVEYPYSRFQEVRAEIEGSVNRSLTLAPDFAERVMAGRREERFIGTGDLPNFFRTPHGPGWALVGDAGYHKDPVTGNGIMDAFIDAELLADAIDAGFAGRAPLDHALAGYEQARNERAMPLYEFTCQQVSFLPMPPEQKLLLQALRGNQEDTNRFLGLTGGSVKLAEFMTPENLGRIIAQAQQRAQVA